ncbi:LOW QUALITY PROTEIN: transcription initiation factor TFIID subunit 4-like [Trachemys scripta elegans]|uniref:LOW QUALITY PROTEIN: transcription initiation factor TFIID subunit 4-like n=1 Tax=Trachemys scripta elegans TaxID=31138 RepID=UPI0015569755|nr:LOW QUALITY PROTEIN: transcription initiation factor TFIID subunit 4-like [Trachemys scripta elegans]
MAAGASDPLEEMLLFSEEVDEKAVSDLVGSLESQLAGGRGSAEGPPPNSSPPSHQQQEHQGSLVEGGSPVQQQQQGHPAPPHFPGAGETARCPSAVGSPLPAQGAPPALSPSAAAAGRGASVNSSSMQQSHGAAPCSSNPSAPAAPVPLQSAAPPPPVGAPAQPVSNHVDANAAAPAVGSGAREVESPRHGCSPPAAAAGAVNSVLLLNSEAATAGGSPEAAGAVTPVAAAAASRELAKAVMLSSTAAAPPPALSLLQRPALHSVPPAAHSGNGTSSSAPVVVTQSLKAGCAPAAITQVVNHQNPAVSHSKPDSSTAQTKLLTHNPAVNALSNSTSSVPTMNLVTHPAQSSVANCAPVVSSPITLTAISKPTVNIIGPPGSAVGVAKSATAVPVVSAVPQSLSPRPAVGTAQRIVAPQLIVRPPQQTTIQLPPGFTIPPGMVLVRTEAGQLVMVPQQVLAQAQVQAQVQTQGQGPASISPRLSVPTSGPVFRLTTTQQPTSVAASAVHLGLPRQAKVVQSTATPVSATSTATLHGGSTLSHTTVSIATTSAQSLIKATVATGTPATQQPTVIFGGQSQTPAQPQGQPRLPLPPHTTAQVPAQPQVIPSSPVPGTTVVSQEMQENVKKCKNFLATLIKLASHNSPSPETSHNVKALVQDLLDAKIDPEEFTGCLQSELKSSPQPYLVPFLKKSLPALRQSLLNSQHSVLQGQPSQQPLQQTKLSQVIPQPASGSISSNVTTQTVGIRQPNSICTFVSNTVQPPQVKLVQSNPSSQLIIQSTSAQTVKRNPACQTTQIRMPVVITQTIRPQGTVGKAPTIQASQSPGGFGVQVSANQKNKLNDPGGGSFRDDDDINDVASMAGVNLNEESARIMATNSDLVGTQIQSCKDEPFLAAIPLHKRILEMAKKLGITDVPTEVVTFISHATQNRLRTVIEKVTMVTQHRMESHKDDEWYEQATDVRSQLKFFEQLEHLEKQRKDEQEREILLKAAKSRSRQEDPEQARLKQKAKEMQQQELAQMRQRDANLTALAAIGPRKKRKLDSAGLLTIGGEVLGMTSGSQAGFGAPSSRQYARQKITRVNLRDFIFYMEQERETSHSLLLYRALLK